MYPLKFKNIYYDKPWGSNKLLKYREDAESENIGESWEIACHENGITTVKNGEFKGQTLIDVIYKMKASLIGDKIYKEDFTNKDFPLLIKLISSGENLSVQVHPDDDYAKLNEGDNGKIEAWYIIDCEDNAEIIVGTKNCTESEFIKSCTSKEVENYMNKIHVKPGEIYLIKPGLLHSIGKGIILLEIQQNSDITYRVYDYNRGRQLHTSKALDVVNFELEANSIKIDENINSQSCISKDGFNIDILRVKDKLIETSDKDKFYIYTCIEGEGVIKYEDNGTICEDRISKLESILIPAYLGNYIIEGNMVIIKSYI